MATPNPFCPTIVVATTEAGESPNKVRVKQLSDKLTVLQDELEQEKQVQPPHRWKAPRHRWASWAA